MIGLVLAREAMPMPRGCDPMRIVSHMWSPGTDTSPVSRRINLSADDDLIHHQQGINVSGHGCLAGHQRHWLIGFSNWLEPVTRKTSNRNRWFLEKQVVSNGNYMVNWVTGSAG